VLSTLNNLRLLLIAAWLGAAVFFSAAVAPAAFQVSRGFNLANPGEIAGALVNRTLGVINLSGFVLSALLIVLTVLLKKSYKASSFIAQLVLLMVVLVSTAVGEWVIASRMRALRTAMAIPIEQVTAGDPMRVAFQALHGYSVAALSIAIIAALIAFIFMAQRRAA
jgi:hypothetical protein